jgi:hypothetical protein
VRSPNENPDGSIEYLFGTIQVISGAWSGQVGGKVQTPGGGAASDWLVTFDKSAGASAPRLNASSTIAARFMGGNLETTASVDFQEAIEFIYSGKTRYLSADEAMEFEVGVERYAGQEAQQSFFRYQPSENNQNLFSIRHENGVGTATKAVFGRRYADDFWFGLGAGHYHSELAGVDSNWFTSIDANIPLPTLTGLDPSWLSVHLTVVDGEVFGGTGPVLANTPVTKTESVFHLWMITDKDFDSQYEGFYVDPFAAVLKARALDRRLRGR